MLRRHWLEISTSMLYSPNIESGFDRNRLKISRPSIQAVAADKLIWNKTWLLVVGMLLPLLDREWRN